jgi:protein SCO1/2
VRGVPDGVGSTFNVVVVSFDPREKPPLAAVKKATYLEAYGRPGAEDGWHFLTGDPLAIATLADAVGFRYRYDPATEQYAHGSGLIVLAKDGTLTRYLPGVSFPARDLRLALAEASDGRVGTAADQTFLLCYQYDPATGTYTLRVLRVVRVLSAAMLVVLGVMVVTLRQRRRHRDTALTPASGANTNPGART